MRQINPMADAVQQAEKKASWRETILARQERQASLDATEVNSVVLFVGDQMQSVFNEMTLDDMTEANHRFALDYVQDLDAGNGQRMAQWKIYRLSDNQRAMYFKFSRSRVPLENVDKLAIQVEELKCSQVSK